MVMGCMSLLRLPRQNTTSGDFNHRGSFPLSSGGWNSKIKVSLEASSLGFQRTTFVLHPHTALPLVSL